MRSRRSYGQTDSRKVRYGQIDSTIDPDQEYIYFIWSETLPSACYIHTYNESCTFYSTSNGYNNSLDV